jgi:hypothetical protein
MAGSLAMMCQVVRKRRIAPWGEKIAAFLEVASTSRRSKSLTLRSPRTHEKQLPAQDSFEDVAPFDFLFSRGCSVSSGMWVASVCAAIHSLANLLIG